MGVHVNESMAMPPPTSADPQTAKPVKAYKNPDFLMGEEARAIRILCEYLEPETRFRQHKVRRAIIFFGSARLCPKPPSGPDYCSLASDLAEKLAHWTKREHAPEKRFYFCSGSGPGIMEAAASGVARVDRGLNIGLNISLPFEQHINRHVTQEMAFEFHYFFMRKFWFMNLAEAMVVFPGGFGTLDELFEMLTLVQTGKAKPMPFVLFGREFWNDAVNFEALARRGLISRADLDLIFLADTVDEAYGHLTSRLKKVSGDVSP